MTSVIHGYYTLCRSRCGTLNTVDGDQLISVEPDPSHPTGKALRMTNTDETYHCATLLDASGDATLISGLRR
jgi:hypothetical protein